jgi:hypothetical protein
MRNPRFLHLGWAVLGSVGVVAGFGGLGKSTWWVSEVALLTRGEMPGFFEGTPRNALVLSAEDQWSSTIKPRLIAAGADLDRIFWFEVPSNEAGTADIAASLSIPEEIDLIRQAVLEYDCAWVILDPLVSFLSDSTDSHKDASSRRVLDPLNQLATELDIAITGIMHFNKTNTTSAYDKLSGSSAFYNACRYVFFFGKAPDAVADDPKRYLVAAKHNMAKLPRSLAYEVRSCVASGQRPGEESAHTSKLVYLREADIAANELFAAPASKRLTKRQQAAATLNRLLEENGGVVSVHEYLARVQAEIEVSDSTARRAVYDINAFRFKLGDFDEKS